ncbi:PleD-like protein [Chondrocystis sp. NIES-4102]|nr:PleD-like protein [Chondrocystis sp. NIES-4102]
MSPDLTLPSIQNPKKVLVVTDTLFNLQLLFEYLGKINYQFFIAKTSQQARDLLNSIRPEFMIVDLAILRLNQFDFNQQFEMAFKINDHTIIFINPISESQAKILHCINNFSDGIDGLRDYKELLIGIKNCLTIQELSRSLFIAKKQQQLLADFIENLSKSLDLESVYKKIIPRIGKFLQCDRLSIVRLTNANIVVEAEFITPKASHINFIEVNLSNYDQVRGEREKYYTGNIKIIDKTDNSFSSTIINNLFGSQIIVPILLPHSELKSHQYHPLWGWLIIEQTCERKWHQEELSFLRQLSNQLGLTIKHILLYQQLEKSNQQMQTANLQLRELAFHDPLTQVSNRRYFERQLNIEWRRLRRIPSPLSVIFCDIDCFKIYNDTYGHQQGDRCLRRVAQALAKVIKRPADLLARYGGEEFIVILPYTPAEGALTVAELMRVAVRELRIPHLYSVVDSVVTISVGVATAIPNSVDSPYMLVESADQALYKAKQNRDCVAVF